MKLATTAPALPLALGGLPALARYQDCSSAHEQALRNATPDAVRITDLVAAALEKTVCSSHIDTASLPNEPLEVYMPDLEFSTIRPSFIPALITRWFGASTLSSTPEGLSNTTKLLDHYRSMNAMLRNDNTLYACSSQQGCKDFFTSLGRTGSPDAYTNNSFDNDTNTYFVSSQGPRVVYCGHLFEITYPWAGLKRLWQQRKSRPRTCAFASPHSVIHEASHAVMLEKYNRVDDIAPYWNNASWGPGQVSPYGGPNAQLLALQDPFLALHNADNYAFFAMELALTSVFDELPESALEWSRNMPKPLWDQLLNGTLDVSVVTPKFLNEYMKPAFNETWKEEKDAELKSHDADPVTTVDGPYSRATTSGCATATSTG